MTAPAADTGSSYGSPEGWARIIQGGSEGATSAMQGAASYANTKKEAKEAKRRTLARLLDAALKRDQNLFRVGQQYQGDLSDYRSQALQNTARGFAAASPQSLNR